MPMPQRVPSLLIASGNRHKVQEIEWLLRRLMPDLEFTIMCAADFPEIAEPEETGSTFIENAIIKAHAYARATGLIALADDSGLVVDALEGRPGIRSARYAESSQARNARVLEEMKEIEGLDRSARFVCVAALADPSGPTIVREGVIEGHIAPGLKGDAGFGYDPIFIPNADEHGDPGNQAGRTLGEYSAAEKNQVSHRRRAFELIADAVSDAIRTGGVGGNEYH